MTEYVYILWDHDEYGPEWTMATTNRESILEIINEYKCDDDDKNIMLDEAERLLLLDDSELAMAKSNYGQESGVNKLAHGYGSLHLQVLRLR